MKMDKNHKRIAVLGVSSLLLLAMIVAATLCLISSNNDSANTQEISTSKKAINTLCSNVDYQDTCVEGLSSKEYNQTDDPKELVKIGMEVTMKHINAALNKSVTMEKLEQDPRTKEALSTCSELAKMSIQDLERSFNKFADLDISELNVILADLKVWLSGAMTSEETCLDGFENTTGEASDKMREALKLGMQMTTNSLAMVTEIATAFAKMNNETPSVNRRLLSFPDWVDPIKRKIIEAKPDKIEADVVVAQDGSGKYKTINEALKDIPKSSNKTFVIHIKEGVYEEKVEILSNMTHLLMIGDGSNKTKITGKLNVIDGTTTYRSATVAVRGDYFIAKDIAFENSAGPEKEQAVALRVSGDKAIFYNCRMDGYQDTLYTHAYRQFYRDCEISGTIDFVFGDAAVLFQNCTFLVRKPLKNQQNIVTAQGRKNVRQPTGIVFQNCTITADKSLESDKSSVRTYLARPWKEYSRTIIMESYIDDVIHSQGYLPWNATFALDTLFYTEFNNRGPSSSKDQRLKWPGIKELTSDRIQRFTATHFIDGDLWIPETKVPYASGLILPPPTNEPEAASPISLEEDVDFNRTQTQQDNDLQSALKTTPSAATSNESNSAVGSPPPSSSPSEFGSTSAPESAFAPEYDSTSAPVPAPSSVSTPAFDSDVDASVPAPSSVSTPAPAFDSDIDAPVPTPCSASLSPSHSSFESDTGASAPASDIDADYVPASYTTPSSDSTSDSNTESTSSSDGTDSASDLADNLLQNLFLRGV